MDNSKRKFLKRAGQSSAMLILFAYGGGKLLAANNPLPLKTKWDGLLLKDPKALFDLPKGFSYKVILSSGDIMSDGLKYGANYLGIWEVIKKLKKLKLNYFELGEAFQSSMNEKKKGLNHFKKSFGCIPYPYFKSEIIKNRYKDLLTQILYNLKNDLTNKDA